ncbi:FkbM family methyltransferase [uncultured Lacinutrix sp.]|uniref:FkbM family methyltransferase n=1 Tax=uncultured Lacinutrix sp. TaxID=574032 RepID=UPI0026250050|nr:FkbM family methyltransferase [uncultured Lacinutrix sp.]
MKVLIKKIIKRIKFNLKSKNERLKIEQDNIQYQRCIPWFEADGDNTLRLNYPLDKDSVVFDLGGYKGEFATDIYNTYESTIYVFEPILSFYNIIKNKFVNNSKVKPFQYGLAGEDHQMQISLTDNSSSVYIKSKDTETIKLKSIVNFIKANAIQHIDLIKINIEGGEYDVLESLIENSMLTYFTDIQIQFHDFIIPNAKERMQSIQKELAKTHKLTYQYEFVWENWTLK